MNHEKAVRDAAVALHQAITAARKAGFVVTFPTLVDDLPRIAISETKKTAVTVQVTGENVDAETAQKAERSAQKAADRTIERASK